MLLPTPITVRIGAAACPVCLAAQRKLHQKLLAAGSFVPRGAAGFGGKAGMGADVGATAATVETFELIPQTVALCSDPSTWPPDVQSLWSAFQSNPASFASSGFGPILAQQLTDLQCPDAARAVARVTAIVGGV